ncbi:hypothetical protein [Cribrihabitans neustonicus]|uniref:hypothetical protein n=1 Tax=Cribrihabitans neustonicus TaxID=1429085 RepID=UPI003B5BB48B
MSVILNKAQFLKSLDFAEIEAEDRFRDRVRDTVREGLRRLIARTPVWSGQTVANYVVTAGAPYSGLVKAGFEPTPGTNNMPLGTEPNRPQAEAIAWATFESVSFDDPYQQFYITNRAPQAALLEIGAAPDVARSRSPNGMFVVTAAELELLLQSNKL